VLSDVCFRFLCCFCTPCERSGCLFLMEGEGNLGGEDWRDHPNDLRSTAITLGLLLCQSGGV